MCSAWVGPGPSYRIGAGHAVIDRDNIHRWSMIAARIPHFPQRAVDGAPPLFLARSVYGGRTLCIARRALAGRLDAGETQADVARTYNVDAATIGRLQPSPFEGVSAAA